MDFGDSQIVRIVKNSETEKNIYCNKELVPNYKKNRQSQSIPSIQYLGIRIIFIVVKNSANKKKIFCSMELVPGYKQIGQSRSIPPSQYHIVRQISPTITVSKSAFVLI